MVGDVPADQVSWLGVDRMIGNISKGRGFRGTLNYLLEKEKGELIGGNMLGQTARELAAEFKLSRQLNPTIKQPVYHVSLSLPLSERLDSERWNAIAKDYLQEMGFTDNQYAVVRHSDRSHDHIHIVAARGRLDGKCVNDWQDYYRSQNVIRKLETEYHLEVVAPSWEVERRGITKGQFEQIRREEAAGRYPTPSLKQQIQDIADQVILSCATPEQFIEKIKDAGVDVQLRTRRDGSISGISYQYELDGITVATPGTKLGTDYTWNGILGRIQELSQQPHFTLEQRGQEGRETALAVQELFKLTGTERQPDGELIFDGNNWRLKQLGNTVSVTVKADDREILRVEGGKVVVFEPTPEERETMQHFREQVQNALQNEQQRRLEAERKQSQELSL